MKKLDKEKYISIFKCKEKSALKKAWEVRSFEIELYWKRATYFWIFNVSIFAGYVAVGDDKIIMLLFAALGVLVSFAWFLANKGSKVWQQNWENHIDLLEDNETGPLYKTIFNNGTYSVSKLNEAVSGSVLLFWMLIMLFQFSKIIDNTLVDDKIASVIIVLLTLLLSIDYVYRSKWARNKTKTEIYQRPKPQIEPTDNEEISIENRGL